MKTLRIESAGLDPNQERNFKPHQFSRTMEWVLLVIYADGDVSPENKGFFEDLGRGSSNIRALSKTTYYRALSGSLDV